MGEVRVLDAHGEEAEVFLVPYDDNKKPPAQAWVNTCPHEHQRLYREGLGVPTRDGGGDLSEPRLDLGPVFGPL